MFCISNTIGTSSGVAVAFTNNLVFSQGSYLTTGSKWIVAWNIAAYIQIACAILFCSLLPERELVIVDWHPTRLKAILFLPRERIKKLNTV